MTHLGDLLSAYLDGELAPDEHNRVVSHLGACGACRRDLDQIHHARSVVRSLPTIEAPHWVIGTEVVTDLRRRGRSPLVVATAVAAAVLTATIGVATWLAPTPELELNYTDISTTYQVRSSQDGTPTGARLVQIVPLAPGGAE